MPKTPTPGRVITSTPTKPTITASQRRHPAHSPSRGPASAVMTIGEKNMIDMVSASCSVCNARKLKNVDPNRKPPRRICKGRLRTRNIDRLAHPLKSTSTRSACIANRTQATNGAGKPDSTRYFALVSRQENRTPPLRIRRIADDGVAVSALFVSEVTKSMRPGSRNQSA